MKRIVNCARVLLGTMFYVGLAMLSTSSSSGSTGQKLDETLKEQEKVNHALDAPSLHGDTQATRNAVKQTLPQLQKIQAQVQSAHNHPQDGAGMYVKMALKQVNQAVAVSQVLLQGPDQEVMLRHGELKAHVGAALAGLNLALKATGKGPSGPSNGRMLKAQDLELPQGYEAEVVIDGLDMPSVVQVAADGTVFVAEAGYSYGLVTAPARVLRIHPDGKKEVVADGFAGPVAGLAVHGDDLFVASQGQIKRINLKTHRETEIVGGLPQVGDHFTENLVVGSDGKLYIAQGTVTNTGVVGVDNFMMGWLPKEPQAHDRAGRDLTLNGENYTTGNPLTDDPKDIATTGPYQPFGTPCQKGQVVKGEVKCAGAVLRCDLDGSNLEVFADGFRNPYGLAFHPDGRLFAAENGPDDRGSRPVKGPDNFYQVDQGGWYGWPDFFGGVRVDDPSRKPEVGQVSKPALLNPPPLARKPTATFPAHSAVCGFDFSRSQTFGHVDEAFVTLFGSLGSMTTGGEEIEAGHRVVRVNLQGQVETFVSSKAKTRNDNSLFRPTDAKFDSKGDTLYVTHFGELLIVPVGVAPTPGTGVLIRITRKKS